VTPRRRRPAGQQPADGRSRAATVRERAGPGGANSRRPGDRRSAGTPPTRSPGATGRRPRPPLARLVPLRDSPFETPLLLRRLLNEPAPTRRKNGKSGRIV